MNPRVWIKSRLADRALAPLRSELVDHIDHGSVLLEIGCGTGALMFHAASKISYGYGIDLDCEMINYAVKKCRQKSLTNIEFACLDVLTTNVSKYDISTSTLCLHELKEDSACAILETMINSADKVLIADYSEPNSFGGKVGIEMDEFISGHYRNFRKYRKNGWMPAYAKRVGARINSVTPSVIDGITIWELKKDMHKMSQA